MFAIQNFATGIIFFNYSFTAGNENEVFYKVVFFFYVSA